MIKHLIALLFFAQAFSQSFSFDHLISYKLTIGTAREYVTYFNSQNPTYVMQFSNFGTKAGKEAKVIDISRHFVHLYRVSYDDIKACYNFTYLYTRESNLKKVKNIDNCALEILQSDSLRAKLSVFTNRKRNRLAGVGYLELSSYPINLFPIVKSIFWQGTGIDPEISYPKNVVVDAMTLTVDGEHYRLERSMLSKVDIKVPSPVVHIKPPN